MKNGLIILNPVELNVLQVALDHMREYLRFISDKEDVTLRLKACEDLIKAVK
jgi:hypothetical protein